MDSFKIFLVIRLTRRLFLSLTQIRRVAEAVSR